MFNVTPYLPLIEYLRFNTPSRPPGLTEDQWIAQLTHQFASDPRFQQIVAQLGAVTITEAIVDQAFPGMTRIVDPVLIPAVTKATQSAVQRLQRREPTPAVWGWVAACALVAMFGIWISRNE